jgi:hypothetical protein
VKHTFQNIASTTLLEGQQPGECHKYLNKEIASQALVTHTCNPTYSGGRDQEAHNSKPAWANGSQNPILK